VFPASYSPFETVIEKYLDSIYDQQKDKIIDAMLLAALWVNHTSTDFKFIEAAVKTSSLDEAAGLIDKEHNFAKTHPYFKALADGSMTKEQFASSQNGFYFVVEAWPQSLSLLMAKISGVERRLPLVRNLQQEHGITTSTSHTDSFQRFLKGLGTAPPSEVPVHISAFNASMMGFSEFHHIHETAAMLGCIEHLYVDISKTIATRVIDSNWMQPGEQSHYTLHEEIDSRHARELFEISAAETDQARTQANISLQIAAYYFWNLYLDMHHTIATPEPASEAVKQAKTE